MASSSCDGILSAMRDNHSPPLVCISTTMEAPFFQGTKFDAHPTFGQREMSVPHLAVSFSTHP
eukprot:854892-Lingulodinium_polyedra.AAC.1